MCYACRLLRDVPSLWTYPLNAIHQSIKLLPDGEHTARDVTQTKVHTVTLRTWDFPRKQLIVTQAK